MSDVITSISFISLFVISSNWKRSVGSINLLMFFFSSNFCSNLNRLKTNDAYEQFHDVTFILVGILVTKIARYSNIIQFSGIKFRKLGLINRKFHLRNGELNFFDFIFYFRLSLGRV